MIDSFVIRTESDIHAEFMLIMANSQRVMTDADRVWQAERVKELLIALKASGFKFGRRMREEMAVRMGTSSTNVARYEKISADLVPELRQEFDAGRIGISQAYEYARQPADVQVALSKQRQAEKAPRPVKPPAEKTALVAGGMEHGITSAAKVESEKCEATRASTREEIVIHVTSAVFGRLKHGAEVVFVEAGGKRFEARLAQKGE
ncbi:MAG TPA: hypothetical protein PKB13_09555 [Clostridia bacterium]|nr:hypothetical protein [Clostridia bacterium]